MRKNSHIIGAKPETRYVNLTFDENLLARIEDFQFKNRFVSRSETVRWLIKAALDEELTPKRN